MSAATPWPYVRIYGPPGADARLPFARGLASDPYVYDADGFVVRHRVSLTAVKWTDLPVHLRGGYDPADDGMLTPRLVVPPAPKCDCGADLAGCGGGGAHSSWCSVAT